MKQVWVEKYRPKVLDEVVGQKEIIERLKAYAKTRSMPHLLFAGPAGTGKTTCAIALAKELFGENWKENFQEMNASDERGIQIVRTKIKNYARIAPMGDYDFKIIFLDEADALTPEAQAAMRRTMEKYTQTCRFIMSCNYSSKIIEPIQSRCAVFRFRPLSSDDIKLYLLRIAKAESKEITEDGLEALVYVAEGDCRKATNSLQVSATMGDKIDSNMIYRTASLARPEEVKKLLTTALGGSFLDSRKLLDDLLIVYGLSGEDVIRQIHRAIVELPIPDNKKVHLVDKVGECEFRMVEGGNERIQLEALLSQFILTGDNIEH
jgi:replication factor C small subunit